MKNDDKTHNAALAEGVTAGSIAAPSAIARHTPTPWAWESIAEKSNEWAVGQAWREDGTPISGRIDGDEWLEDTIIERRLVGMNESGHANFADAEFIVRACNSHDELVAALKSLANEVSGAICLEADALIDALGVTNLRCIARRVDEAKAAIRNAEGR